MKVGSQTKIAQLEVACSSKLWAIFELDRLTARVQQKVIGFDIPVNEAHPVFPTSQQAMLR
jgi:hypothetical protein